MAHSFHGTHRHSSAIHSYGHHIYATMASSSYYLEWIPYPHTGGTIHHQKYPPNCRRNRRRKPSSSIAFTKSNLINKTPSEEGGRRTSWGSTSSCRGVQGWRDSHSVRVRGAEARDREHTSRGASFWFLPSSGRLASSTFYLLSCWKVPHDETDDNQFRLSSVHTLRVCST